MMHLGSSLPISYPQTTRSSLASNPYCHNFSHGFPTFETQEILQERNVNKKQEKFKLERDTNFKERKSLNVTFQQS